VFAAVAMILLAVAGAACLMPAWRASRLDPMVARSGHGTSPHRVPTVIATDHGENRNADCETWRRVFEDNF
jgi:hypothetical protein